jgi:hypothetical protein
VRARPHRDGILGDVDAEEAAGAADPGEEHVRIALELREVEVDARVAGLDHLGEDRAADDVARRELGLGVVLGHEAPAHPVAQDAPGPAHDLADQRPGRARDVEAGRVELDELQVAHARAGAEAERDAVAGRDHGVGRLAEELARAAGRDDDLPGREGDQVAARGARQEAPRVPVGQREQVEDERVREGRDPRVVEHGRRHRALDLVAGRVALGVDDPRVAVAALAREVDQAFGRAVELRPHLQQALDRLRPAADDALDRLALGEPAADAQRVGDVRVEAVRGGEDRGESALGVDGVGLAQLRLGDQGDRGSPARRGDRRGAARDAAADDDDVEAVDRHLPEREGHQVAVETEGKGGAQAALGALAPARGNGYVHIRQGLGTQARTSGPAGAPAADRDSIRVLFGSIRVARFGIRSVGVVTGQALKPPATLLKRRRIMTQILSITRREKLTFLVFALLIATTFLF